MIVLLCAIVISGSCVVNQRIAYTAHGYKAVKQQVAYQVLPLYVASDSNAAAERLQATEEAIQRLTDVVQQQQLLIQSGNLQLEQNLNRYEIEAQRILQNNCMSCHSGRNTKGGFTLDKELDIGDKLLIVEVVADGSMPPNKPLSDKDTQTLASWSRENAEEVRNWLRGERPRKNNDFLPPHPREEPEAITPRTKEKEERKLLLKVKPEVEVDHWEVAESIIVDSCINCHYGDKPKGGFSLDDGIDVNKFQRIMDVVFENKMPPKKPLEISEKMALGHAFVQEFGQSYKEE